MRESRGVSAAPGAEARGDWAAGVTGAGLSQGVSAAAEPYGPAEPGPAR